MNGLIKASLNNPYAVTVTVLTLVVLGTLSISTVPMDILPVYRSPAVQVLTFYGGMPAAGVEKDITNRMERWTGQAAGTKRQESRSIVGASIIRNYYQDDVDPNGALAQVMSLATAAIPNLPPGTFPPVVLPFDPTSTVPACLVALDSHGQQSEAIMYDVARYEVRNHIMNSPGAVAPVVYGGKIRAVMAYLNRVKLQARGLSPLDVMRALEEYNLFLPTGDAKFGHVDYALESNSMFDWPREMGSIPLRTEPGNATYLRDVAKPKDSAFIQTNVVRVNGNRQVYIPVYRQLGSSTLKVVDNLKDQLKDMPAKLSRPNIDLKVVMDQSVYVRHSITSLVTEGVLGAILCSLVILLFLGEWRMTAIAVLTIPISIFTAITGLYLTGNTINVMTLAGLALAIGPLVDSAIICLENTHRHLTRGAHAAKAAFWGASEVAMPELVASCCTLLVLAPLAFQPGLGQFLFRPMALAVAFAMIAAYLLSRSFVPSRCANWLKTHTHAHYPPGDEAAGDSPTHPALSSADLRPHVHGRPGLLRRIFVRWEEIMNLGIAWYGRQLHRVMKYRALTIGGAAVLLVVVVLGVGTQLRREFFPEVDAGAFEMTVRAPSGTKIESTEDRVIQVEEFIHETVGHDVQTIISELGVTPDWSAAYTPNSGPMDVVIKVQLTPERARSAQDYVDLLRRGLAQDARFTGLEFSFDAGGMIRGAMNEGKSTPINVRVLAKKLTDARSVAESIMEELRNVDGVVDLRILQRLDYPRIMITVDRAKAAQLGLNQDDVMKTVVSALNSSIQFNKRIFWIDPVSHNQYFVGVQYPEEDIKSIETLLNVHITSPRQKDPISLSTLITYSYSTVPAEIVHNNLQPTMDLTMGVYGRDLGHVAEDVARVVAKFGVPLERDTWTPFDPSANPTAPERPILPGARIILSGEYTKMQDTFHNLAWGLCLAALLIYFLMAALFKSWITPLVVMSAVPVGLVGVVLMLWLTGTAINVQSLLGVIFMVGIVVSNTVLMTDFAQKLRETEGLSPTEAILKAASIRVRPVVMTALATFFALVPMALALERGSEANAPLGRAVIGGLLAGLVTTLFVVPAIYSLVVKDAKTGTAMSVEQ
jgi:multidrug efflux pump subunit AcrB